MAKSSKLGRYRHKEKKQVVTIYVIYDNLFGEHTYYYLFNGRKIFVDIKNFTQENEQLI